MDATDAPPNDVSDTDDVATADCVDEQAEAVSEAVERIRTAPLDQECAKARAVLNANIGACHVKLVSIAYPHRQQLTHVSLGRVDRCCERMHRR